jgi:hypothetical protein
LARIGKLKAHAADKVEIARLLESAERALNDAAITAMSSDTRLKIAYGAIVQAALAALFAKGYRPTTSEPGHHQLLVQVLALTMKLPAERIQVLDAYRKARNQAEYRGIPVSDAIARECLEDARRLVAEVRQIGL